MVSVNQLKSKLNRKPKPKRRITSDMLLSTGSTMLNLACTGRPLGGLIKGKYYLFVGDSASGKTILVLTILAEAANNPHFDNYRLIFDDIEGGALFDMAKFYGRKMASRLEPPRVDKDGAAVYSESVEDVYYNIDNAHQQWKKDGRPFIYFVDSMDSLMTGDDEEHFTKKKKAHEAGTQAKGSFGAAKPKLNSRSEEHTSELQSQR